MTLDSRKRSVERWDRVFRAISAEPRRQVIMSLLDSPSNQSVPLPYSAINPNVPVDPDTLKQELYHIHLPMLADLQFIEWDTDPFVASQGPHFNDVAIVFEALQSTSIEIPDSFIEIMSD